MSKFYDLQSSESDSSESEVEQVVEVKKKLNLSSDSEDEKRVVRSNKEKKYDEIQKIIKDLRNHKNIKDLTNILQDFDLLSKSYEKYKKANDLDCLSKFYIRVIAELEDYIDNCWKNKKDFNKNNSKSLAALRQKLKKYNKDFENEIEDFRKNETDYPTELIAEVEIEVVVEKKKKENDEENEKDDNDDDDDEDDEEWDETSSESSDDGVVYQDISDRFLKTNTNKKEEKKKDTKKVKEGKKKAAKVVDDQSWTVVDTHKQRLFAADEEISVETVLKKLNEEMEFRFTRKDIKKNQADVFEQLFNIVSERGLGLGLEMKIKLVMLSNLLQYRCNSTNPCMHFGNWEKALKLFGDIVEMLENNIDSISLILGDIDEFEKLDTAPFIVHGCVVGLLQQIDNEYSKMLVNHDFNDFENMNYTDKFLFEKEVISLCNRVSKYIDNNSYPNDKKCIVYDMRMNHLYYRIDNDSLYIKGSVAHKSSAVYKSIQSLSCYVVNYDTTEVLRQRAIMYFAYFLALHDHYQEAMNTFLMSGLLTCISRAQPSEQVLFNRVTVQLGICAFKLGLIKEAHEALAELQGSGRVKELLAQSVRNVDRRVEVTLSAEELYKERLRLLPYHKHINSELIEGIYLICAMLLHIQHTVVPQTDGRKQTISKNLHYVLKSSERLTIVGPPETLKDHIVSACKAMFIGDWQVTVGNIFNEKMDRILWRKFGAKSNELRVLITEKIKTEALKIFIIVNCGIYETMSVAQLSDSFKLSQCDVTSLVSKLILNKKLKASLDEPSNCIIMSHTNMSRLQGVALKLADKLNQLMVLNENIVEPRGQVKQRNY